MPEPEQQDLDINMADVKIDTFKASGAGGQHVNTTDSAVRLTHGPSGLVVSMQDERCQHKNRKKAFTVLRARLFERQQQQEASAFSSIRSAQVGSGDRSEKIRTYNFKDDRVTDHRIRSTKFGVTQMLSGQLLSGFLEELEASARDNFLKHLDAQATAK